ncbi:MAG: minichromosome maintenance protein MCM [Candidatus Methanomethylicia archaeon]
MNEIVTISEMFDIQSVFESFLKSFQAKKGEFKYRELIRQMVLRNQRSLYVDFDDILIYDKRLVEYLLLNPTKTIESASRALLSVMKVENAEYARLNPRLNVRFKGFPDVLPLRQVRAEHVNRFVRIDGILTRISQVRHKLVNAVFECQVCHERIAVEQRELNLVKPNRCVNARCKNTVAFKLVFEESSYIDWQKATLQEKPEELPPGELPRSIEVIITDDIVDIARPGDRVSILGILKPRVEVSAKGLRLSVFSSVLEANCIEVQQKDSINLEITQEDIAKIHELSRDLMIVSRIKASVAPSIYGYDDIKEAIAYMLFGGEPKILPDGVRIRGDINILLIGDPGTAKSQLLRYVAQLAPRGLYTSGKGTTAAGLTATVIRDKSTGEYYLEAGALVLSDGGIACIDEIDKMDEKDRVAMHEAMEQQTVSIAKAGIVATLNARTAILAAANPILGRYQPNRSLRENTNLPITILSRFDLIFPLRDEPEPERDEAMTSHILMLHQRTESSLSPEIIPPELLRKYIIYAKANVRPRLSDEAKEKIKEFFLNMRTQALSEQLPIPISPRQLESLVRLAEARARIRLSNIVTREDSEAVIRLLMSFLTKVGFDESRKAIDIDKIMTGVSRSQREELQRLLDLISTMQSEVDGNPIDEEKFYERAEAEGFTRRFVEKTIHQLKEQGILYSPSRGKIARV